MGERTPEHSAEEDADHLLAVSLAAEEDDADAALAKQLQDEEADRAALDAQEAMAVEDALLERDHDPYTDEMDDLDMAASNVMSVVKPVTVCLIIVIFIVRTVTARGNPYAVYLVYDEASSEHANDSTGAKIGGAILNAFVIVIVIVLVTFFFVFLYKYNCTRVIYGWLMTSTTILLAIVGGDVISNIFDAENWALDIITLAFFIWNFAVVGLLSVFYLSPLFMQQCYLVLVSSFMAASFSRFPEWTTWALLAAVATYDVFAVLCPKGPLRMLIEEAQERPDQPLPGLLYSAGMVYFMAEPATTGGGSSSDDGEQQLVSEREPERTQSASDDGERSGEGVGSEEGGLAANPLHRDPEESSGIKLGLGDFIFYSVLVSRAAMTDWVTVFICSVALVMGLCLTLMLLGVFKKALPALPISIALGIVFYFLSAYIIVPFFVTLSLGEVMF